MDWVGLLLHPFSGYDWQKGQWHGHDDTKKNYDDNECNATLWQYLVFFFSFVSRPTSIELPRPHLPPFSQGFISSFQFSICCFALLWCYFFMFDMLFLYFITAQMFPQGFICLFQFLTWCCYYCSVWYAVAFICSIAAQIFNMLLLCTYIHDIFMLLWCLIIL